MGRSNGTEQGSQLCVDPEFRVTVLEVNQLNLTTWCPLERKPRTL